MFTVWGGPLISLHTKTADCQGGHTRTQQPLMLTAISATKGKSNYGNPGEGEERRAAEGQWRREWNCSWTKGVVGVGREEEEGCKARGCILLRYFYITSSSHSLRSKLTHCHACFPPSPGGSHSSTTFLTHRHGFWDGHG